MRQPNFYLEIHLASEIVKIFKDADLAKKLGIGGLATATKYSAENIALEWERIYNMIICQKDCQ